MQETHGKDPKLSLLLIKRSNTAHIFPHIQAGLLISIGQICDDGCTATFTATYIIVDKKCHKFLEVHRKVSAGMW